MKTFCSFELVKHTDKKTMLLFQRERMCHYLIGAMVDIGGFRGFQTVIKRYL